MSRKTNLPSRSHRPSFPRPLPSRCGVPRFAAPAAYGFPRRRGFQHSDGRRVPRLTRSLSECWKPRQVCPPFPPSRRLFRAFNGRRVPSPTRRLLEGWESRPRVPRSRNDPAPSCRPQGSSKKAKEKGHPPGCPSSFTDRTPPDSGYGLLVLTSCYGSGAFPSGSRTPYPQGRRTTRRPP